MFTKNQLLIIGIGLVLVIGFSTVIYFNIDIPSNNPENQPVNLTAFGIDSAESFATLITEYQAIRPNVKITYRSFPEDKYETAVIDALATGDGPDIIMVGNDWITKHKNKLTPVNSTQLPTGTFEELFPKVVAEDFSRNKEIYALPLFVDTLALFYNKDTFDAKAVTFPPKTWTELINLIGVFKETNSLGAISKPAITMGGSGKSVAHVSDIFGLLMLQTSSKTANALKFYTGFGNSANPSYTWSDALGNSQDVFAEGVSAMTFGYANDLKPIKNKNPFLDIGVAKMVQNTNSSSTNVARYWGLAAPNERSSAWAWDFIIQSTTNIKTNKAYLELTSRPPALRALITEYLEKPSMKVFAAQALTARSFNIPDPTKTPSVISNAIESVLTGRLTIEKAADQIDQELNISR